MVDISDFRALESPASNIINAIRANHSGHNEFILCETGGKSDNVRLGKGRDIGAERVTLAAISTVVNACVDGSIIDAGDLAINNHSAIFPNELFRAIPEGGVSTKVIAGRLVDIHGDASHPYFYIIARPWSDGRLAFTSLVPCAFSNAGHEAMSFIMLGDVILKKRDDALACEISGYVGKRQLAEMHIAFLTMALTPESMVPVQ